MNLMYYRNLCQHERAVLRSEAPEPERPRRSARPSRRTIKVPDIDPDTGDAIQRPATPADHFKNPWPNEPAARASNGGALPPDLSVMARAREGGPDYIYSILSWLYGQPAFNGMTVPDGQILQPLYAGRHGLILVRRQEPGSHGRLHRHALPARRRAG